MSIRGVNDGKELIVPETDECDDWTTPGVFEVIPGVHRIPLPLPNDALRSVNVYAIVDHDAVVLIDSGWAISRAREALEMALGTLGCGFGDIREFLITHMHRDHYSQAVTLRQAFGTRVSLGRREYPSFRAGNSTSHRRLSAQLHLLRVHGASDVAEQLSSIGAGQVLQKDELEMPDDWIDGGQEIWLATKSLKVVETPGHTRGHVVFVDGVDGVLYAGDHVLPHITPSIGFEPAPVSQPLRDYLASLRIVRSLPDMRLLPAHGPVGASVHQRVDEILEHHDIRLSDSFNAVLDGATTASEVAHKLSWTSRSIQLTDLDPFNQMLAILETASHLDLLVLQGKLQTEIIDGLRYFESARSDRLRDKTRVALPD